MRLPPTPRAQRFSRAAVITGFYGALLLVAIGVGALTGRPNVFMLPGPRPSATLRLAGPAIGLGLGLVMVLIARLLTHRVDWARRLHQEFHALVHGLGPREILLLALSSSIAEEAFFRGALQPLLGVVPQALLFAAVHFRPRPRFYPWTIMSFIVGVGFGMMARWFGDLSGPIASHFIVNALNLSYIARTELRA